MSTVRRRGYRPAGHMRGRSVADNRGVRVLADKSVVLGACGLLALFSGATRAAGTADAAEPAAVIWLLLAVITSGLCAVADWRRALIVIPGAYLLLGCSTTASVPGAPLVVYDLVRIAALGLGRNRGISLLCCAPLLLAVMRRASQEPALVLAVAVGALAALLALRTWQDESARQGLHAVRDDLREKVLALQESNARLLQAQDHEMRAAALAERTRIAREIHDGVGHLLTRLLLAVKALRISHRDQPGVVSDLAALDSGLDEALASMRRSVHALSDEGEELATALGLLGSRCGIGRVSIDCSLDAEPPAAVSRCIAAVVREALTNAARHGRAGSARVVVADYPAFWQVRIDNDGAALQRADPASGGGLGLRSMTDRVEALGGTVRVTPRPRFTVFAMIPKGGEDGV